MADVEVPRDSRGVNHHLDVAVVGVGELLTGVVGEQVLGTEFVANLPESFIELASGLGVEVLATRIGRKLN